MPEIILLGGREMVFQFRAERFVVVLTLLLLAYANQAKAGFFAVGPWPSDSSSPPMNLYAVDEANGNVSLIGDTAVSRVQGLTTGPDGGLLGHNGNRMYSFDAASGAATLLTTLPFGTNEGALAGRPGTSQVYFVNSGDGDLFVYDLDTNVGSTVGQFGLIDKDISAAAFDPSGTLHILFATRFGVGGALEIATVDLVTAEATTVLTTPWGNTGTAGMAFDDAGVGHFTNGSNLYTFDVGAGTSALVGAHGVARLAGLSYVVPEPSTLAVTFLLLSGFIARRR